MRTFTLVAVIHRPERIAPVGPLSGRTVLIVEDEPLIALDLHAALRATGADLIAATRSAEALALIRRNDIHAAIVDVALGGEDCLAVCQALFHRRVPFLFYTGHGDATALNAWPEAPLLLKPARHDDVVATVIRLTAAG
jgi:DNA-binding response OmpR family regulator